MRIVRCPLSVLPVQCADRQKTPMHRSITCLLVTAALLVGTPPAIGASGPDLAAMVDRAWALARASDARDARAAAIEARALATEALFPGAPEVSMELRRDLPRWSGLPGTTTTDARGFAEMSPGMSVPLWLPGQRDAQRQLHRRERVLLDTAGRALRLQIAGEVREAAWALRIARADERVQQARAAAGAALRADVEHRVAAGTLAPVDALTAAAEHLAASAAARDARDAVALASSRLLQLTGIADPGDITEAPRDETRPDAHPALTAAHDAVDVARARRDERQVARRDNPRLTAAARFERDTYDRDWRNTLRVGIALPLDTEARNAPRLSEANAALVDAELTLYRLLRSRQSEIDRARIALAGAQAAAQAHAERAETLRRARAAIERAFAAGELGLPDVLRVRAQTLDAELAHERAREQTGLAVARLNQALGQEP